MNNELPEGWSTTKLDENIITDFQPGFACGENNQLGQGIPQMRPMNVSESGLLRLETIKYVAKKNISNDNYYLKKDDVLFNNTNSPELVGKTAIYTLPESYVFSNHMTRLRCNYYVIYPKYCATVLHQLWREGYFFNRCNHHVSQASISTKVLKDTAIQLPPLAEQKRIVAMIEELLPQVDAVNQRLDRVSQIMKRFRRSVLDAACSGKLTENWGERNTVSNVHEESTDYYQLTTTELPEIPGEWIYVSLGSRTNRSQYGTSVKATDQQQGNIPILRMGNIQDGLIDYSELKYITVNDTNESFLLNKGDLLFNRTNSPELVGKSAVFDSDIQCTFASYLIRLQFDQVIINPIYVCYWLNSSIGRSWANEVKTDGVSQSNINARKLQSMPFPLPSKPEQDEIVRRVESLFKLASTIEQRVEAAKLKVKKLTQSILNKAFRGELVPTEAELARQEGRSYEPASVLLERIKSRERK
ncbi:MAG: restriction endonuclease subunit S [Dehalococcoidales bacterium]|nr:restriction endonuclease subunit S [Dehalococcoidales bacterium]